MRLLAPLLRRKADSHKGDFGHIFIIASSRGMTGAGLLCAKAAMRTGAGMVTLGVPETQYRVVARRVLEVMTRPLKDTGSGHLSLKAFRQIKDFLGGTDVLVIGPGLSRNKETQRLIQKVILQFSGPMVIDADGINALATQPALLSSIQQPLSTVLTPHPGEFARLLGTSVLELQKNRIRLAKSFAAKYKLTLVLKGHNTVICDGVHCVVNKTGNPGMATAGSGDVLTGMVAAMLAQKIPAYEAAKTAVYLHGLAGDLAAGEKTQVSLIASDIIEKIPEAIKSCVA